MGYWRDSENGFGRPKGETQSEEERKRYFREYRRKKRREAGMKEYFRASLDDAEGYQVMMANRAMAAYDPMRDGYRMHDSLTAYLMGDPVIGRRALDDEAK